MAGSGIVIQLGTDSRATLPPAAPPLRLTNPNSSQIVSHDGGTPVSLVELGKRLLASARDGDTEEVRYLISKGAPFTTDWLGTSPLHLAAQFGHVETCEKLLSAGISKDARTKVDKTPLHIAAQEGHANVMELLLKNSADVDALDMLRMTPLHWAVERGNAIAVETLLRYGASVEIESKFSKTALEIASDNDRPDIFEMLQNAESFRQPQLIGENEPDPVTEAAANSIMMSPRQDHDTPEVLATSPPSSVLTSEDPSISSPSKQNLNTAEALKFLEGHGITFLPEDDSTPISTHQDLGNSNLSLTEAGKLALKVQHSPKKTASVVVSNSKFPNAITISPASTIKKTATTTTKIVSIGSGNSASKSVVSGGISKAVPRIIKLSPSQFAQLKSGNGRLSGFPVLSQGVVSSSSASINSPAKTKTVKILRVRTSNPVSSSLQTATITTPAAAVSPASSASTATSSTISSTTLDEVLRMNQDLQRKLLEKDKAMEEMREEMKKLKELVEEQFEIRKNQDKKSS